MDDRYRRNVPDPSATIPDFGPRPDVKKVKNLPAETTRTPDGDVPAATAAPRTTQKAPKPINPLLVGVAGVLVAVVFGGLGFFVVVFAGMFIFFLTSMG